MKVFYSRDYVAAGYSFDTTRKALWIAESLINQPIPGLVLLEPALVSEEELKEIHSPEYVRAVKTGEPGSLATSQGFTWDEGIWKAALSANSGVVAGVLTAMDEGVSGTLSSGLHHARRDRGSGFCTFNGLALSAIAAKRKGARRILILDTDAHCGGGTVSLISEDPAIEHADLSIVPFDFYTSTSKHRLEMVSRASDYLPTLRRVLENIDQSDKSYDIIIYNPGMDPMESSAVGGTVPGIDHAVLAERERMVFNWAGERKEPIAFVMAGGYAGEEDSGCLSREGLVLLHRETLLAAAALFAKRESGPLAS